MDRITTTQLLIFQKYDGDIDGLARVGTEEDRAAIDEKTWQEVDYLRQQIVLSRRNLLTTEAESALREALNTRVADSARELLLVMANGVDPA